jgi:multicomponent K+:H+ antiporter subunit D
MRLFWTLARRTTPRLRLVEATPVAVLVLLTAGLTVAADPVNRYLDEAARSLHQPDTYVRTVLEGEGP